MNGWQVGDLAVCVEAKPNPEWAGILNDPHYTRGLEVGRIYKVLRVLFDPDPRDPTILIDVGVAVLDCDHQYVNTWPEWRFRKVVPDAHEACEEEFVTLLKRAKRPVTA